MEVLLSEGEARKNVLLSTLSYDISSKRKRSGWESVSEAFNAVGSEKRTQAEVKKKWSEIKVDGKRRLAAHRRSVAKTGGGGLFEQRVGTTMGDTGLSGVVGVGVWVTLQPPCITYCITYVFCEPGSPPKAFALHIRSVH